MKTRYKVFAGGVLGILMMTAISSTYFYNFMRKAVRRLRESLKDYNY